MPYRDRPGTIWLPDRGEYRAVNVGPNPPTGTPLRDGDVNAQRYLKNGVAIDNNAAYPNIAYLDRANTFTGTPQTVQTLNAVTAIQLNGTSIGVNTAYANIAYIDRSNTFTGTTQTAPTFNGSTRLQYAGTDINTNTALSNVAYLDRSPQTFTGTNTFSNDVTFSGQDRVTIYKSSAHTALTTGATPIIDFNAEIYDVGSLYSSGDTITILVAGAYLLGGQISYPSNATGDRGAFVQVNGTTVTYAVIRACSGAIETVVATTPKVLPLVVSDVVRLVGYQTSGGNLTPNNGTGSTWLEVVRTH